MEQTLSPVRKTIPMWRVPGRLIYVVSHSYPYSTNGYAVRTHCVAKGLVNQGHSVIVLNRPGRPWDMKEFHWEDMPPFWDQDGVRYYFLREPAWRPGGEKTWLAEAEIVLSNMFRLFKPSAVMAASNWENALPALRAARSLHLPFFYEVRGFWELSRASCEPEWVNTAAYRTAYKQENEVAKQADRVFTLNQFMKEALIKRGIAADRIDLIPNAIEKITDCAHTSRLSRADLRISASYVVGYVGSFSAYEGLEDLVYACAQARQQGVDLALLLVGSAEVRGVRQVNPTCVMGTSLRRLAESLRFSEFLFLPGRVKQDRVADYYALIDLVVIPRRPLPVCKLVPPLKAMEALSYGKQLLVSDVPPLKEIIITMQEGDFFEAGNTQDLVTKIIKKISKQIRESSFSGRENQQTQDIASWTNALKPVKQLLAIKTSPTVQLLPTPNSDGKLRIAAIMDEFTYQCYAPECDLLQLHPAIWKKQLEIFQPDIVFIESAWKGFKGLWEHKISTVSKEIRDIFNWAKEKKIPALFWNKEDPQHFERFLPIARLANIVFTTDRDKISHYKVLLGHERVYLLPFAAQPTVHNPIEESVRKKNFHFAGSWYPQYPQRQKDFTQLVDISQIYSNVEIYDRNFGIESPFVYPDRFQKFIVGTVPSEQIASVYKKYYYGINVNTIKQSSTMFARRVFELLASNTVVISNFSRGIRLFFGDLVLSSDNKRQLQDLIETLFNDELNYRKFRLLGLRKVMSEHTYSHRISLICHYLKIKKFENNHPHIIVIASVKTKQEKRSILESYFRQSYLNKTFLILQQFPDKEEHSGIMFFTHIDELIKTYRKIIKDQKNYISFFDPCDYYAESYLMDLALATCYSKNEAFGKETFYAFHNNKLELKNEGNQYKEVSHLVAKRSLINSDLISQKWIENYFEDKNILFISKGCLSIDEFNYIENGSDLDCKIRVSVDDLKLNDIGITFDNHFNSSLSNIKENTNNQVIFNIKSQEINHIFRILPSKVKATFDKDKIFFESYLPGDLHQYVYAKEYIEQKNIAFHYNDVVKIDGEGNLNLKFVFLFLNEKKEKLSHNFVACNEIKFLKIPENCAYIRFGIRFQGKGESIIKKIIITRYNTNQSILCKSPYLFIAKNYPSYDNLYKYGFVHSRLRAYKQKGMKIDFFRFVNNKNIFYREFETIDICEANATVLDQTLSSGTIYHALIHILDENIWNILKKYINKIRITIWCHGHEIQLWQRRTFEFERMSPSEIAKEKVNSDKRKLFWKNIFATYNPNLHFVFVSEYFKKEVEADFEVSIPKSSYSIIHNYIDNNIFTYQEKTPATRFNILSIRPYENRKYGNDLTVKTIFELSKKSFFDKLCFTIVGDGKLFEETTSPLKRFNNVKIEKRFLTQKEIAEYHHINGIFLVPTRLDSQGVSRDEAMSSGLVPVTNNVGAIPEFVDASCGIICPPEDFKSMAQAIEGLYKDIKGYKSLSRAASIRSQTQNGFTNTIQKELDLINNYLRFKKCLFKDIDYLIYADINPNIIDGSSIWLDSVIKILTKSFRTLVFFKYNINSKNKLKELRQNKNLFILEPQDIPICYPFTQDKILYVFSLLEKACINIKGIVVRGYEIVKLLQHNQIFKSKIYTYLAGFYKPGDEQGFLIPKDFEKTLCYIIENSKCLFIQTPFLANKYIQFMRRKFFYKILPPTIPDTIEEITPKILCKEEYIYIGYGGKIYPNWGIEELINLCEVLYRDNFKIKLYIAQAKIYSQETFFSIIKNALNKSFITLYEGLSRRETMELMKSMDFVWCWRKPHFESTTLEISTKLIENAAMGLPCICYPSIVNQYLLGKDYPFFIKNFLEAKKLLIKNYHYKDLTCLSEKIKKEYICDNINLF